MVKNVNRIGRPTSSKAGILAKRGKGEYGFSEAAITYLNKKRAERNVGRSTDLDKYAKPMAWGKCLEYILFEQKLGNEYEIVSKETLLHSKYKFWGGSPDFLVPKRKVSEVKCFYPDKFFLYSEALLLGDIDNLRDNFREEYWQIVSNAAILELNYGEGIAYMPKLADLMKLRTRIADTDFVKKQLDDEDWKYKFIADDEIETLPWIAPESKWPDMAKFEFYIPSDDLIYIAQRFQNAERYITKNPDLVF